MKYLSKFWCNNNLPFLSLSPFSLLISICLLSFIWLKDILLLVSRSNSFFPFPRTPLLSGLWGHLWGSNQNPCDISISSDLSLAVLNKVLQLKRFSRMLSLFFFFLIHPVHGSSSSQFCPFHFILPPFQDKCYLFSCVVYNSFLSIQFLTSIWNEIGFLVCQSFSLTHYKNLSSTILQKHFCSEI